MESKEEIQRKENEYSEHRRELRGLKISMKSQFSLWKVSGKGKLKRRVFVHPE